MNQQFYQPQEQVESDFSLEEKLLEGIFQPTGISVKPSDTLLNDFCKRAKNLNREKIFNILMEKVEPFKEYPGNTEKTKLLTKCLYLIEHLVEHKVEELYDAFDERLELFEEIRSVFSNNRKIMEITAHILKMYNAEVSNEGYSQIQKKPQTSIIAKNVNLLDIDDGNTNNDVLPNEQGNTTQQTTNIDLLSDIFGGGQKQNQPPITNNKPQSNFSFIKPKQPPQVSEAPSTKKGFSFIKSKEPQANTSNDLNSIFTQTSEKPKKEKNDIPDLTKPKFNYDLVYENTGLKEKKENDPFGFVGDMLKAKK